MARVSWKKKSENYIGIIVHRRVSMGPANRMAA